VCLRGKQGAIVDAIREQEKDAMRKISLFLAVWGLLLGVTTARATIFGGVRGIVHDPQHRPIQDALVTLKAVDSDWMQSQKTNDSGEFEFTAVPLGNYTVTAALAGFQMQQQDVTVTSS
jgi:Carboxypeptidase regulatory-like domain